MKLSLSTNTKSPVKPQNKTTVPHKPISLSLKPSAPPTPKPLTAKPPTPKKLGLQLSIHKTVAEKQVEVAPEVQVAPEVHRTLEEKQSHIQLTDEQKVAITYFQNRQSFCLVGKAGTGKTTTAVAGLIQMMDSPDLPRVSYDSKTLCAGDFAVAVLSFTHKAVNNLRFRLPERLQSYCFTIHRFLEYIPVDEERENPETGEVKTVRIFRPSRNSFNPHPDVRYLVLEESSMISVELHQELVDACPNATFIYLGDLNQLKPVFGDSILGYKLNELPVVDLQQVHRQALENPGTKFLLRMLEGKPILRKELEQFSTQHSDKLDFKIWPRKGLEPQQLMKKLGESIIPNYIESGRYDPEEDQILIPFNEKFGTRELNRYIAAYLQSKTDNPTFEIIAGWRKEYLAVGDRVISARREGKIVKIVKNPKYAGTIPRKESTELDRWGHMKNGERFSFVDALDLNAFVDQADEMQKLLNSSEFSDSDDEGESSTQQLSHIITVETDLGTEYISTIGGLNNLYLSYALTVHKAQGSEWRRVWLILHTSHGVLLTRELLYTACSRFREQLIIFCEEDSFEKGVMRQSIPGNTIAEKAAYFRSKSNY